MLDFVVELVEAEIARTDDANIIFRGNSLATKALDQFMKVVGGPFLRSSIGNIVSSAYSASYSCEVRRLL